MAGATNRLSPGEQLTGLSGLALFICSFFPWVGGKIANFRVNGQVVAGRDHFDDIAWDHAATAAAVVIGVVLTLYVGLRLVGIVEAPRTGTGPQLIAVAGALTFLLVLFQLVVGAHVDLAAFGLPSTANLGGAIAISFSKTRSVGIYAGLVASIGLGVGGYLTLRGS